MRLLIIILLVIVTVLVVDAGRVALDRRQVANVANDSAREAGGLIRTTHDVSKGRVAADATAKAHELVITTFHYDSVLDRLDLTVSGSARTLVLHYLNRHLVDLNASASARP